MCPKFDDRWVPRTTGSFTSRAGTAARLNGLGKGVGKGVLEQEEFCDGHSRTFNAGARCAMRCIRFSLMESVEPARDLAVRAFLKDDLPVLLDVTCWASPPVLLVRVPATTGEMALPFGSSCASSSSESLM